MSEKDIEKILNQLKKSIKEPIILGEDYYTGEGWEEPNFFCLDPTTNDCKTLFDYITNLQQELTDCKKKIEMYENPDDLTLFYMWLDEKAKDKIKELTKYKERNEKAIDYVRSNLKCMPNSDGIYEPFLDCYECRNLLEILEDKEKKDD